MASRTPGHADCPLVFCEPLEARRLLTTYYVSPSGSDSTAGTSPSTAFRTIDRINTLNLNAGDRVLFQGGKTFALTSVASSNLVANPGFESGLKYWWNVGTTAGTGATIVTDPAQVHTNARALKLSGSGEIYRAQDVTSKVKPGKAYTFGAWGKVNDTDPTHGRAFAGVVFYKNGVEVGGVGVTLRTTSYKRQVRDFLAPKSFDQALVFVRREPGTATVWVDDVSLTAAAQPLTLTSEDAGTPTNPVTIASYGTGRATISAGDHSAIVGLDVGGIQIQDLNILGTWNGRTGTGGNTGSGIEFVSTLPNDGKHQGIFLKRLRVAGFRWTGVRFEGRVGKAGFSNVRMNELRVHDNGDFGITLVRNTQALSNLTYAYRDVVLRDSRVFDNGGIPDKGVVTGVGVHIGETDGATVERVVAYNNGRFNTDTRGGPVGIMSIDSNKVLFQFNEAYGNKSGSGKDGLGIDFDGGMTNSVMQYNYTHDNDGAGLVVAQPPNARPAWHNNVIRYNISQNDARHGDYGAIHFFGGSQVRDLDVHNNVVFLSPSSHPNNHNSLISAVRVRPVGSGVTVRNNVLITTGGLKLIRSDSTSQTAKFTGNSYWSSGAPFRIVWGGTTFSTLSSWRSATGQETVGTLVTGLAVNPRLVNPGGGGTINDPSRLRTDLGAYKLLSDSHLVNKAVGSLTLNMTGTLTTDFYGNTTPKGGRADVGVHELR